MVSINSLLMSTSSAPVIMLQSFSSINSEIRLIQATDYIPPTPLSSLIQYKIPWLALMPASVKNFQTPLSFHSFLMLGRSCHKHLQNHLIILLQNLSKNLPLIGYLTEMATWTHSKYRNYTPTHSNNFRLKYQGKFTHEQSFICLIIPAFNGIFKIWIKSSGSGPTWPTAYCLYCKWTFSTLQ